ncbi:FAD-dependent oxidoreductase [Bradyrhizobium zhanjiangense]|uniref:FAD-dependent oxidoreductase n=1 Tax=Bradyrhizobium zhanjiangense TaxID=1325107 RepID=UPI003B849685
MRQRLLIVGGSYAACELASQARESGYGEAITIVSEEPELPYHRPPLSKAHLKSSSEGTMPLKAESFYSANSVDLELRFELSLKVGDGGSWKGGISWGCLTPPLLHRRSDMRCPKITSSS